MMGRPSFLELRGVTKQFGVLTAPFGDTPLEGVAEWAGSVGFTALEIACWPRASGATRRYAGTCHIDADGLSASKAKEIRDALLARNISISALGYYPNPLHPDAAHRQAVIDHLKKVVTAAALSHRWRSTQRMTGSKNRGLQALTGRPCWSEARSSRTAAAVW